MNSPVTLSIGETYHLRSGKDRITYAGMPSDNVYSVVQRKREALIYGWSGQAWNLFYPKAQKTIRIDGVNISVEHVSPEEIRLQMG